MVDIGLRAGLGVGLGALLLAGAAWLVQHERAAGDARGAARVQRAWDAERIQQQAQAINDGAANAAETERRIAAQSEVIHEATVQRDRARADADAARAAGQRLRDAQRAYIASALAGAARLDPAAAPGGQAAGAPADLLADLQRRVDEAADGVGRFADESHAAGRACERSYDALIQAPENKTARID